MLFSSSGPSSIPAVRLSIPSELCFATPLYIQYALIRLDPLLILDSQKQASSENDWQWNLT